MLEGSTIYTELDFLDKSVKLGRTVWLTTDSTTIHERSTKAKAV